MIQSNKNRYHPKSRKKRNRQKNISYIFKLSLIKGVLPVKLSQYNFPEDPKILSGNAVAIRKMVGGLGEISTPNQSRQIVLLPGSGAA